MCTWSWTKLSILPTYTRGFYLSVTDHSWTPDWKKRTSRVNTKKQEHIFNQTTRTIIITTGSRWAYARVVDGSQDRNSSRLLSHAGSPRRSAQTRGGGWLTTNHVLYTYIESIARARIEHQRPTTAEHTKPDMAGMGLIACAFFLFRYVFVEDLIAFSYCFWPNTVLRNI